MNSVYPASNSVSFSKFEDINEQHESACVLKYCEVVEKLPNEMNALNLRPNDCHHTLFYILLIDSNKQCVHPRKEGRARGKEKTENMTPQK